MHVEHGSGYVWWYAGYIKFFAWLFDRTLWLRIFRQSDKIITISHTNIPFIKKFTKKPITVIYNPITYEPKKSEHNNIPHIGFVGRLVSLKWLEILIRALKHIEHMTWKCTIVWAGDQRTALEKLVKELWLSSRIVFVWLDDRANRIHKFSIFVNPSYQEGLPTTVIEGLLSKCVVVATDVGGTAEISDQKDLVLVHPGDVQELADAIRFAIDNYTKVSWLSYEEVHKKFSPRESVEKYYKEYKLFYK